MIYNQSRKSISFYEQCSQLPELKEAFPEMSLVGSQCLQDVLRRLDRGFKAFFQRVETGKAGFPALSPSIGIIPSH